MKIFMMNLAIISDQISSAIPNLKTTSKPNNNQIPKTNPKSSIAPTSIK